MNFKKNFFLFLTAIPVIAALETAAGMAGIRTHWYVWEVLIDGKTVLLAGLFFLLLKPGSLRNDAQERGVFRWSIAKNIGAFLVPVILSCLIAGAGLLLKKVGYADPENGPTLLLMMAFDIPAIFIFSVTTVFVEEYLFRGWIFGEFERNGSALAGLFISSVLWAIWALAMMMPLEEFTWMTLGILVLFYCSVGIASGVLYEAGRSLWLSYAFRIGIITVTPSILSSVTGATDAFFSTEDALFFGDGIIASAALIAVFMVVFVARKVRPSLQKR